MSSSLALLETSTVLNGESRVALSNVNVHAVEIVRDEPFFLRNHLAVVDSANGVDFWHKAPFV